LGLGLQGLEDSPANVHPLNSAPKKVSRETASELLNTPATITHRKAGFRSLGDTMSAHRRLMLTVLGGRAEFERELIRARTGDGGARAKTRGVKMGQMTPRQIKEALRRRDNGELMFDVGRSYNVSHSIISRLRA
jgi:DNA invertase Pin-like site-specific DNA recombinase